MPNLTIKSFQVLVVAVLSIAATHTYAQLRPLTPEGYPAKPMRLLVGNAPGGGSDITARLLAQKVMERTGTPVLVDNRAGASGLLAMGLTARAPADGYTLMIISNSQMVTLASTKVDFDVQTAFAAIAIVNSQPFALAVSKSLPVASVGELIAYAKSKRGVLNYASAGNGTNNHLGMELFKSIAGIDMVHVPYKGVGPGIADLIAGQIQVIFSSTTSVMQLAKSGKIKVIAVTSPKRSPLLPEWPTVSESGVPGFELIIWFGIIAPIGVPQSIVVALNKEINEILNLPDIKAKFARDGAVALPGSPKQLHDAMNKELLLWTKVIKEMNIKL